MDQSDATATATTERSAYARQILGQATLLGILADSVLRNPPWGIGFTVWIVALAITTLLLVLRRHRALTREQSAWFGTAVLSSLFLAWRDAEMLQLVNVLATLFALGMLAMSLARAPVPSVFAARVRDVISAFTHAAKDALGGVVPLSLRDAALGALVHGSFERRAHVIRATLLTLPLLLLFGGLLLRADPAFAALLNLPDVDLENVASHLLMAGFFAWLAAGWMRGALMDVGNRRQLPERLPFALSITDISVSLGALNGLFALFVGVQLGWLFGGADVVRETTGLSVAEYARRGFFELVFVAALVVPVILGTRAAIHDDAAALQRHRRLAMPLLGLLGAIMVSAVLRMRLYVMYFGLTDDRLYALVVMLWLALVFLAMGITVLRGWTRPFAAVTVISGYAALFALNLANPELIVARVDLSQSRSARPVDYPYLASLSGDAAPLVANGLASAPPSPANCAAAHRLYKRWVSPRRDWMQWNLGDARARSIVPRELAPHSLRRLCASSKT